MKIFYMRKLKKLVKISPTWHNTLRGWIKNAETPIGARYLHICIHMYVRIMYDVLLIVYSYANWHATLRILSPTKTLAFSAELPGNTLSTKTGICWERVNPKPSDSLLTITVRSCHNRPIGKEEERERRLCITALKTHFLEGRQLNRS